MINNDESASIKVPDEIKTAIDNYKNQVTVLGLEVNRLERLKAQTELSISTLNSLEASKTKQVEKIAGDIANISAQLKTLNEERETFLKESKEMKSKREMAEDDLAKRTVSLRTEEIEMTRQKTEFDKKQKTLIDSIESNKKEKEEIERKKNLISDLVNKL